MKLLNLENSTRFALVDEEDYERLNSFKWYDGDTRVSRTHHFPRRGCWRTSQISLASEVMNAHGISFDHKDRNYLNNTKSNLRRATQSQNSMNATKAKNCLSKFKGVSYEKRLSNPWRAYIRFHGKLIHLGNFKLEAEAAKAYDDRAKKLFGEFAVLNFPETISESQSVIQNAVDIKTGSDLHQ